MKEYFLIGYIKEKEESEWIEIPELVLKVSPDLNPYEALDSEMNKIAKYWLIYLKENLQLE